ncbi:hypothetical protein MRB53_015137 [Persea americana]|uniref:Uncharacterized protein n=1 Tax=Persea americana TaxID=3435 RepID=A0ACC2KD53_PERAE|nr:hypothetical protein MRB53_015137 [Persea americana]
MDLRIMGLENPILSAIQHMLDVPDEMDKSFNAPTRTYIRDAKAMASTPVDIIEYPNSYVFVVDMPGLKSQDIKVQIEEGNILSISGEQSERTKTGKAQNAITAVCHDGVLPVTVEKIPPPEPKQPKSIEVKVA